MRTAVAALLLLALVSAGCARGTARNPAEEPAGAPSGVAASSSGRGSAPEPDAPALRPAQQDPPAAGLLPREETPYSYHLSDGTSAEEFYVRDGGRLIGASNGKTHVTWFIAEQGVWRRDPKGPGLLRYFPPVLQDGTAWKQRSGDAEVWFLLREKRQCQYGLGPDLDRCWELTVLNRLERLVYELAPGNALPPDFIGETRGINRVWADHLQKPGEGYTKQRRQAQSVPAPPREQMLKEGDPWPAGPVPAVAEITPAEFAAAEKAMLARAGRPYQEIDLNGDGRPERIEGKPGEWHTGPLQLLDSQGRLVRAFHAPLPPGGQIRLDVISVPGIDRPALLYQAGRPDTWHQNQLLWLHDGLVGAYGWWPKTEIAFAAGIGVEPDGTVVMTGDPKEMAGYALIRRYRVETASTPGGAYQARLTGETIAPGPYPATPGDLLTAAFIARWYGLEDELRRYIPGAEARSAFKARDVGRLSYYPLPVQVGKLTMRKSPPGQPGPGIPEIEPAAPGPDGAADFLATVQQYEGYGYYAGRVTFGQEADGRLVIRQMEFRESGWVY